MHKGKAYKMVCHLQGTLTSLPSWAAQVLAGRTKLWFVQKVIYGLDRAFRLCPFWDSCSVQT